MDIDNLLRGKSNCVDTEYIRPMGGRENIRCS